MSEIILDTITGKSTATTITIGSTPVVSSSANSMTIRGEGSNQTSIQQGLVKVWSCVNQGTTAFDDSFNCSSIADVATGRFTPSFTISMNNALYSLTGCCDANGAIAVYGGKVTGSIQMQTGDAFGAGGLQDYDNASTAINGDLA